MKQKRSILRKIFRGMLYSILTLLLIWIIAVQSGYFSMRTPDQEWATKLQKLGQSITPHFFNVPTIIGRTIHAVEVSANDTLPLIIMVHGSPGSADANMIYLGDTALTSVARLVSVDRPGFGFTTGFGKPEPSQAAQAAAIKAVADKLAPGQKVFLVGHSLGGPVIARFAMDYPELVAGLVIVAGSIDPDQEAQPWWQVVVDAPPVSWLCPKPLWTSNAEIMPLKKELELMVPLWERITCPVYLIHAVNDQLVPIANVDFAKRMLKNSRSLKTEILQAGDHFILWSRPDIIRKTLLQGIKPLQGG